jgi:uncharacterized membrane protein
VAVFGVPYTNYLGWWFVTYHFFQVFTSGAPVVDAQGTTWIADAINETMMAINLFGLCVIAAQPSSSWLATTPPCTPATGGTEDPLWRQFLH